MNLFGVMDISGSALEAERVRAEVVAANMANAETTRTASGGPYQRQHVVFEATGLDRPQNFAQAMLSTGSLPQAAAVNPRQPGSATRKHRFRSCVSNQVAAQRNLVSGVPSGGRRAF